MMKTLEVPKHFKAGAAKFAPLFLVLALTLACSLPGLTPPTEEPPTDVVETPPPPTPLPEISFDLPDTSGELAFASDRDGWNVYSMNADGSNEVNLTGAYGQFAYPAWSPDGQRLAMRVDMPGSGIVITDMHTENGQLVASPPVALTGEFSDAPSWSPDGTQVMYIASPNSGWEFFHYDLTGSGTHPVSTASIWGRDPKWSPDGNRIVYSDDVGNNGQAEIFISNLDGGGKLQLTNNAYYDGDPTWSPDGSKIAFTSKPGENKDIYIMNADGTNVVRLTTDPADEFDPSWSPDGTRLAFVSERDGNYEIYLINSDGSAEMRLTYNNYTDRWPVWRPGSTATGQGTCQAAVHQMADVTIPVGTQFTGSAAFNKIWRLENTGNCTWTPSGFQLRFVAGNLLGAPPAVIMPGAIQPNSHADIVVPMAAPETPGLYSATWQLFDADGNPVNAMDGSPVTLLVGIEVLAPDTTVLPAPLYYLAGSPNSQIWRMETDGHTVMQVTHETEPVTSFSVSSLDNTLAYISARQLLITDSSGSARQVLLTVGENEYLTRPVWSPDGMYLAYGYNGIHLYDRTSGDDRVLIANATNPSPAQFRSYRPNSFSPDGSKMLLDIGYYEWGGQGILDVSSSTLLSEFEYGDYIAWGRDSQNVFLARTLIIGMMALDPGLLSVPTISGGATSVLIPGTPIWWPKQAPDGRLLYFMGQPTDENSDQFSISLYASDADGVTNRQLLRPEFLHLSATGFAGGLWTPDASQIVSRLYYQSALASEVLLISTDNTPSVFLMQEASSLTWGR